MPRRPFAAVRAYVDLRSFGVLPRAGGTFDQPAALMAEIRFVAQEVGRIEEQKRKRETKSGSTTKVPRVRRFRGRRR